MDDATRLRIILDNVPGLVAFLDPHCRYQLASRSHLNWFGLEPAGAIGRHVRDIVGAEAWRVLGPHYDGALAGETASLVGEVQFAHGGSRYIHSTAVPRTDGSGNSAGLLALTWDLTEHKLMEKALDASTRRARAVLETSVDGIITIDEEGAVQSFNRGAEAQFGYAAADVIGRNVKMLMPAMYAARHDEYLKRYVDTGERHIIGIGREVEARHKDGSEFPIELAVGEFVEDGRHFFTGFTRDISERKAAQLEARIRHSQLSHSARLNSLGELAASIAHEVNQPLTAIVTMSQALLRYMSQGADSQDRTRETLEKIVQQGRRAGDVIQHIRNFLQNRQVEDRAECDLNQIVRGAVGLLDYEFKQNGVALTLELDSDLLPVCINKVEIEQVLVNLFQNAVQAMADVDGERVLCVISQMREGARTEVEIRVRDTGHGLPEGAESRVFEPFFTTRSGGMGQGLSISRSIMQANDGTIRAERNHGRGATFVITLPAHLDV